MYVLRKFYLYLVLFSIALPLPNSWANITKRARKVEHVQKPTLQAAKELARWFGPLTDPDNPHRGVETVANWLKMWILYNWRRGSSGRAWRLWGRIDQMFKFWNPAPLYRDLLAGRVQLRWIGRVWKGFLWIDVPRAQRKDKRRRRRGLNSAPVILRASATLHPLKGRIRDRRPYLFTFQADVDLKPLYPRKLDTALLYILRKVTDPALPETVPPAHRHYLAQFPGGHSKRVLAWLHTHFPNTAVILARYFRVEKVLEPIGGGKYKLDLIFRWKIQALKKDYPHLAKLLQKKNRSFETKLIFTVGKNRYRWLEWSYNRRKNIQRYRAVISSEGFWLCDSRWRPRKGPWRPTAMGAQWYSQFSFRINSPFLKVMGKNFLFRWKVGKIPGGESLSVEIVRPPRIYFQGGTVLRMFSKLFISGGLEGLVRRFFKNLARGDGGRGLRWNFQLQTTPQKSKFSITSIIPIVPEKILTSLLRTGASLLNRRPPSIFRNKKRLPPLWYRVWSALYTDISESYKLLKEKGN